MYRRNGCVLHAKALLRIAFVLLLAVNLVSSTAGEQIKEIVATKVATGFRHTFATQSQTLLGDDSETCAGAKAEGCNSGQPAVASGSLAPEAVPASIGKGAIGAASIIAKGPIGTVRNAQRYPAAATPAASPLLTPASTDSKPLLVTAAASVAPTAAPTPAPTAAPTFRCPAGQYGPTCEDCPAGTWGPLGANVVGDCVPCAAGKYSSLPGAPSEESCVECGAGKYSGELGATSCADCPAGTYSSNPGATSDDTCIECPMGTYSPTPGATSEATCLDCGAGKYSSELGATSNETCVDCPAGTYSSNPGATSDDTCIECPMGTYSPTPGATSEATCLECGAGKYSSELGATSDEACVDCPAGTYSSALGATSQLNCTECHAGKYSSDVGATNINTCVDCPMGTYSSEAGATSEESCIFCDAGKYSSELGASSEGVCTECPIGTYLSTPGGQSEANCTACAAGKYSGDYGATSCVDCPAGTYSSNTGATGNDTCIECPIGTYSATPGAPSEDSCLECEPGKYSSDYGATSCAECPAGTYSSEVGATGNETCVYCPMGTYSPIFGAPSNDSCIECVAGKYSSELGATNVEVCIDCPAGTYSPREGATSNETCVECPMGTFSLLYGASSNDTCIECQPGKFSSAFGATSCVDCPAGTYSASVGAESGDTCVECPMGTYSPTPGAFSNDTCMECEPGKYSSEFASTTCTNCPAGTYSPDAGAASNNTCVGCPMGTFSDVESATSLEQCLQCEVGTISPTMGSTFCIACVDGEYSAKQGTQCRQCPVNTYSARGKCRSCGEGLASPVGSTSADDCQNLAVSYLFGILLLIVSIVLVLLHICSGRANRAAFVTQQTATLVTADACNAVAWSLLRSLRATRSFFWKFLLLAVLVIAIFVSAFALFVTNVYLLSRSFMAAPTWIAQLHDEIEQLVADIPALGFLEIVLDVAQFFDSIDFSSIFAGMRISCEGSQAPAWLLVDALIIVSTVLLIDSQCYTMLTLSFAPTTTLLRDRLISSSARTIWAKAGNFMRFLVLAILSTAVVSSGRYFMQLFATLVDYGRFIPAHAYTEQCDDVPIDSTLARASTIIFFVAIFPVFLLMIRVLMPGLPQSIRFATPSASHESHGENGDHRGRKHLFSGASWRWLRDLVKAVNPLLWLLDAIYRLMVRQYEATPALTPRERRLSSTYASILMAENTSPAPTLPEQMALSVDKQDINKLWKLSNQEEIPRFSALLPTMRAQGPFSTTYSLIVSCAWKLKLAVLCALGVWTDESVEAMKIDQLAEQYFSWVEDYTLFHEDVMAATAPIRSMTWMLVPATILLTKLAEATNNPPIFVFTKKVYMMSPLYFETWEAAEDVTRECERLLEKLYQQDPRNSQPAVTCFHDEWWQSWLRVEHEIRVCLVWVLGARLPRYVMNMILIGLAIIVGVRPYAEVFKTAFAILLPWAIIQGLAAVFDVHLMLRLRKQRPRQRHVYQRPNSVELTRMTREYSPDFSGKPDRGGCIPTFYNPLVARISAHIAAAWAQDAFDIVRELQPLCTQLSTLEDTLWETERQLVIAERERVAIAAAHLDDERTYVKTKIQVVSAAANQALQPASSPGPSMETDQTGTLWVEPGWFVYKLQRRESPDGQHYSQDNDTGLWYYNVETCETVRARPIHIPPPKPSSAPEDLMDWNQLLRRLHQQRNAAWAAKYYHLVVQIESLQEMLDNTHKLLHEAEMKLLVEKIERNLTEAERAVKHRNALRDKLHNQRLEAQTWLINVHDAEKKLKGPTSTEVPAVEVPFAEPPSAEVPSAEAPPSAEATSAEATTAEATTAENDHRTFMNEHRTFM